MPLGVTVHVTFSAVTNTPFTAPDPPDDRVRPSLFRV